MFHLFCGIHVEILWKRNKHIFLWKVAENQRRPLWTKNIVITSFFTSFHKSFLYHYCY